MIFLETFLLTTGSLLFLGGFCEASSSSSPSDVVNLQIQQGRQDTIKNISAPVNPPRPPPPAPLLYFRCNIFRDSTETREQLFACCRNYPRGTWLCPRDTLPPPGHICASVTPPACCCANPPPLPTTPPTTTTTTEAPRPPFVTEAPETTDEDGDGDEDEDDEEN